MIWLILASTYLLTVFTAIAFFRHLKSDTTAFRELNDANEHRRQLFNMLQDRVSDLEKKGGGE